MILYGITNGTAFRKDIPRDLFALKQELKKQKRSFMIDGTSTVLNTTFALDPDTANRPTDPVFPYNIRNLDGTPVSSAEETEILQKMLEQRKRKSRENSSLTFVLVGIFLVVVVLLIYASNRNCNQVIFYLIAGVLLLLFLFFPISYAKRLRTHDNLPCRFNATCEGYYFFLRRGSKNKTHLAMSPVYEYNYNGEIVHLCEDSYTLNPKKLPEVGADAELYLDPDCPDRLAGPMWRSEMKKGILISGLWIAGFLLIMFFSTL